MTLHAPKNQHDRSYRRLFSHPRLVEELIRGFFGQEWVEHLDFTTLERVNASFVTKNLRAREGDMIWKLRTREGRKIYVYLLLELQSSVDRFMAVRLMGYESLLYQDLIKRGELTTDGKLPLVIPIVLYNGETAWSAALDVAELIEAVDPNADRFRPVFRYRLIDERSYSLDELRERKNLAAVLFWLEKTPEPADLQRGIELLVESLSGPGDSELRSAFAGWLQLVRLPGQGLTEEEVPEVLGLEEFRTMLEKRVEEWNQILLERGRQEGEKKGRQEGRRESRDLLLRQLEIKFGTIDARTKARVRAAGSERLLEWAERLVTAEKLGDIFAR